MLLREGLRLFPWLDQALGQAPVPLYAVAMHERLSGINLSCIQRGQIHLNLPSLSCEATGIVAGSLDFVRDAPSDALRKRRRVPHWPHVRQLPDVLSIR